MIVIEFIVVTLIVILCALVINAVEVHNKLKNSISFKEAMDLAELPVVTFYQGSEKFNFLLDTGSNHSHISASAFEKMKGEVSDYREEVFGAGGAVGTNKVIHATVQYKDRMYEESFLVGEYLDGSFSAVKTQCGVQIHGILGSKFLNKHRYILDFADLIAYPKH